ncbi:MAG: hypothetical protein FD126_1790 [Elusimicrobia bacterium]|nr:MAG: hypothetical protein FD126_1790 [Elusimicrobiota bacterium]
MGRQDSQSGETALQWGPERFSDKASVRLTMDYYARLSERSR